MPQHYQNFPELYGGLFEGLLGLDEEGYLSEYYDDFVEPSYEDSRELVGQSTEDDIIYGSDDYEDEAYFAALGLLTGETNTGGDDDAEVILSNGEDDEATAMITLGDTGEDAEGDGTKENGTAQDDTIIKPIISEDILAQAAADAEAERQRLIYDTLSETYLDPNYVNASVNMSWREIAEGLNRAGLEDQDVKGWLNSASFATEAFEQGLSAQNVQLLKERIWSYGANKTRPFWGGQLDDRASQFTEEAITAGDWGPEGPPDWVRDEVSTYDDPFYPGSARYAMDKARQEFLASQGYNQEGVIDPSNLDGSLYNPATGAGIDMDRGFFNLADLPQYEEWLPAYQRTPEEYWSGLEAQMEPFWQVRAPLDELGRRLQARYMLAAPEMAMDVRGIDPTMSQYFQEWEPYASTGFTGTAPGYFAYSDPNELLARAKEAGMASMTDEGKFIEGHERGTPGFARAAWLSSQFGPRAQNLARSLQNQREIASLIALQKPTGGAYGGQMAQAMRGAVANLQNRRAALGATPESFLNWFVSPRPGQAPKVLPRYGLAAQVAQEGERG